jgi:hypothetical protein
MMTAAELVVTVGEEALDIALDVGRGRARLGGKWLILI